jgi:hypothetical protein
MRLEQRTAACPIGSCLPGHEPTNGALSCHRLHPGWAWHAAPRVHGPPPLPLRLPVRCLRGGERRGA